METSQQALQLATKKLQIADHMTVITFPVVKDPKLLMGVAENILEAFKQGMLCVLLHKREYQQISPFDTKNVNTIIDVFQRHITRRQNNFQGYAATMREVKELTEWHKKAPVEFARKNTFVMCSQRYETKELSEKKVKEWIQSLKHFLTEVKKSVM